MGQDALIVVESPLLAQGTDTAELREPRYFTIMERMNVPLAGSFRLVCLPHLGMRERKPELNTRSTLFCTSLLPTAQRASRRGRAAENAICITQQCIFTCPWHGLHKRQSRPFLTSPPTSVGKTCATAECSLSSPVNTEPPGGKHIRARRLRAYVRRTPRLLCLVDCACCPVLVVACMSIDQYDVTDRY